MLLLLLIPSIEGVGSLATEATVRGAASLAAAVARLASGSTCVSQLVVLHVKDDDDDLLVVRQLTTHSPRATLGSVAGLLLLIIGTEGSLRRVLVAGVRLASVHGLLLLLTVLLLLIASWTGQSLVPWTSLPSVAAVLALVQGHDVEVPRTGVEVVEDVVRDLDHHGLGSEGPERRCSQAVQRHRGTREQLTHRGSHHREGKSEAEGSGLSGGDDLIQVLDGSNARDVAGGNGIHAAGLAVRVQRQVMMMMPVT